MRPSYLPLEWVSDNLNSDLGGLNILHNLGLNLLIGTIIRH